jgi:hypothetical protein
MPGIDQFAPERWQVDDDPAVASVPRRQRARECPRKREWFLRGPVPWGWLVRAMALPGRALAVGLILWREWGCTRERAVYFSLHRAARDGIPRTTARRAIRALEGAGLVSVARKPGRGLEVTLLDVRPDGDS